MFFVVYPAEVFGSLANEQLLKILPNIQDVANFYNSFGESKRKDVVVYDMSYVPQIVSLETLYDYQTGLVKREDVVDEEYE